MVQTSIWGQPTLTEPRRPGSTETRLDFLRILAAAKSSDTEPFRDPADVHLEAFPSGTDSFRDP